MTAPRHPLAGQGKALVIVFLGGMLGAPARYLVESVIPTADEGFPLATFVVNIAGALALGLLLESLSLAGPDTGMRQRARLFLGTGFLGAFTTYSSFAVEIDLLARADRFGIAVAYAVSSLVLGLVAVAAGVWLAHAVRRGARVAR